MSQNTVIAQLLAANEEWRNAVHHASPDFFPTGATGQTPKVLWIGCADSRVPESVVVAAKPGDLFVHRNIAKYVSRRARSLIPRLINAFFAANSIPMMIQLSLYLPTP